MTDSDKPICHDKVIVMVHGRYFIGWSCTICHATNITLNPANWWDTWDKGGGSKVPANV